MVCGKHHHLRAAFIEGAVVTVNGQVFGSVEHAFFAEHLFEPCDDVLIHHFPPFLAAVGPVKQCDRVDHLNIQTGAASAGGQLHLAAGAAGGNVICLGGSQVVGLALQHFEGSLVMRDELAAGGTAAPIGFGQFDELDPIDHFEEFTRLLPHPLGAAEVAGVVVGDAGIHAQGRFFERDGQQEFADVAYFGAESCRPGGPGRVVCQYVTVILEGGTAGGAIGDDELHLCGFEEGDVVAGLLLHLLNLAETKGRHAATDGLAGGDDGAAVAGQHTHTGGALLGEEQALGAA